MSTRCNIIIKGEGSTIYVYRHSDGYPDGAGSDLKEFVKLFNAPAEGSLKSIGERTGGLRRNPGQSAGWLIVRGHFEYKAAEPACLNDTGKELWPAKPDRTGPKPDPTNNFSGWKVGAYEPTDQLHSDVEFIYIIDFDKNTLSCRVPKNGFWDNATLDNTVACKEFKTVRF